VVRIWDWPINLHDDPRVHALREQQGRCGMPPVVKPDLAHTRLGEEDLPCLPVRLALDRPAIGGSPRRPSWVAFVLVERRGDQDGSSSSCGGAGFIAPSYRAKYGVGLLVEKTGE
jgi:hypothetical protein